METVIELTPEEISRILRNWAREQGVCNPNVKFLFIDYYGVYLDKAVITGVEPCCNQDKGNNDDSDSN